MAEEEKRIPQHIEIRGAKVHNLKNIDVDIPLGRIVGIPMGIHIQMRLLRFQTLL